MKTANIIPTLILLLILIPLAFIIVSVINYAGDNEYSIVLSEQEVLSIMQERVKNDFHYKSYGGHELELISMEKLSNNNCKGLWRDYFGSDTRYQTCYEGVFMFLINNSAPEFVDKYMAKTWLLGTTTKGFEITEINKGE